MIVEVNEDVVLILIWIAVIAGVFCAAAVFSDWVEEKDRNKAYRRHLHLYKKARRTIPTRRRYDVKPAREQR
jgi:hypothetical protein